MRQQLFISDLHLSEQQPILTQGFIELLRYYQRQPTDLYILGDWFEVWLDDNDPSEWLLPIVQALREFTSKGNQVRFLVGNRDFLLGQRFLDHFGGQLISEPHIYQWQGLTIRLEHGDALCTDDLAYQRYKNIIRHPLMLSATKVLPFKAKKMLANHLRKKSKQQQQNQALVDVNQQATEHALTETQLLIHGHTHQPAIYRLNTQHYRIVLGDWRTHSADATGHAKIFLLSSTGFELLDWQFSIQGRIL